MLHLGARLQYRISLILSCLKVVKYFGKYLNENIAQNFRRLLSKFDLNDYLSESCFSIALRIEQSRVNLLTFYSEPHFVRDNVDCNCRSISTKPVGSQYQKRTPQDSQLNKTWNFTFKPHPHSIFHLHVK